MIRSLGGIRLPHLKGTENIPTKDFPLPERLTVLMAQSMGAPCEPLVKKGDTVAVGMKLGDSDKFMSVPVHSPASGTVEEIKTALLPGGGSCKAVVIATDGRQTVSQDIAPPAITDRASLLAAVRESGCCGLGGAGFPTHIKLGFDPEKTPIDTLLINGAECEPYITADYREFMENGETVLYGAELIMKTLGIGSCIIGIEKNKPEAVRKMQSLCLKKDNFSVCPLPTSYPQGAEKVLIYSATGRIVEEGELPSHRGVIVMNVSTAGFLGEYFKTGMPLVSKRLTLEGDALSKNKGCYRVPVGTQVEQLLSFCGAEAPEKVLYGGPMMGVALESTAQPITKLNNAIVAFKSAKPPVTTSCIRCGRCIRACPVRLMPVSLESAYDKGDKAELLRLKVNLCINCGCCTYVCPANRPLAEKNQLAKQLIAAKK